MTTIEIDFDVFQKLTVMRESESVTCSDVIRSLLKMNGPAVPEKSEMSPAFQGLSDVDVKFFKVKCAVCGCSEIKEQCQLGEEQVTFFTCGHYSSVMTIDKGKDADAGDPSAEADLTRRGDIEQRHATSDTARELGDWTAKGVTFPAGTEFRATYKGQTIYARVESRALLLNGKPFYSPSAAAVSITGNPVNGWIFWECKLPEQSRWRILKSLRK